MTERSTHGFPMSKRSGIHAKDGAGKGGNNALAKGVPQSIVRTLMQRNNIIWLVKIRAIVRGTGRL